MSEREDTNVVELLREPEIVEWLEDYRPLSETAEDDDEPPLRAA